MWHGLEHEVTDPAHLYFEPSGSVYNPDPVHLSLLGPQGLGGSANSESSIASSSGGQGGVGTTAQYSTEGGTAAASFGGFLSLGVTPFRWRVKSLGLRVVGD